MGGKIDCSNIYNFINEWERMAKMEKYPPQYPRLVKGDINVAEEYVRILQKWSDEHPKQTRRELFTNIVKQTDFDKYFSDVLSPNSICGGVICCMDSCEKCKKYWDEIVE